MTIQTEVAALCRKLVEHPDEDVLRDAVTSMVQLSGREVYDFPEYLIDIMHALANGELRNLSPVAERDRGYAWLLQELLPILPETEFLDDIGRDLFICHRLQRAAVVSRGGEEHYGVIPWPEIAFDPASIQVMDAFDPSLVQVRQWAYAPNLRLVAQDEAAVVSHPVYLPLLIELADDPGCPKRHYLLSIADAYVTSVQRGGYDQQLLSQVCEWATAATSQEVQAWAKSLKYLLAYLREFGPVSYEVARTVADIVFRGRSRPSIILEEIQVESWWVFYTRIPNTNRVIDYLYVNKGSGTLVWSREPMDETTLARHAQAPHRDDPLCR